MAKIKTVQYRDKTVKVGNCFYLLVDEIHCGVPTGKFVRSGSAVVVDFISDNIGIFKRAGENVPVLYFMTYTELIPDAWMCEDCGTITQMLDCPVCTNGSEVNPEEDR